MTDKERFLNEVKEVKLIIHANRAQGAFSEGYLIGQESVLEHFEKFIDSLQEELVSEDLEEAAKEQARSYGYYPEDYEFKENIESFKEGARWDRQRAIEKACEWMDEHCKLLTSKDYEDFRKYMKGE